MLRRSAIVATFDAYEKAAAQFLKAMREEFGLQSAGDLLIKET